jgi:glucosyl-3-phosphoglycerate phosphatase
LLPTLYAVRHGETDFNSEKGERIRSWMDVPLNRAGKLAARRAALFFRDKDLSKVIASDLKRARHTGEAIARENFLDLETTQELRDWNVGELTGLKVKDAIPQLDQFISTPLVEVPGGEAFNTYLARFEKAFQKLLTWTRSHSQEPLVVVTHSRNFGAAHAYLTGDKSIYRAKHSLPPGGVMSYTWDESQGRWKEEAVFLGDDAFADVLDES